MISFFICLALLIGGYFTYGSLVDRTFGPDDRETPAVKINDGVDYMVLPQWKLFMIQLLNIAGLGPIFGALSGALWGPVVFLWITFGTIFAGAVHDYFSGMLSERNEGASISEISGIYLGGTMKNVMRVFSVVLLIMVGTVFAVGPAGLIQLLFSNGGSTGILTNKLFWLVLILVYYFIATFLSIDKIIGKIYPVFGICLIIMAVGVAVGIFTKGYVIPEIWNNFTNMHPQGTPIWSFMFITVACGAISGFHATQSPLMARCMKSEKQGHFVFYGAMGIVAGGVLPYAQTAGQNISVTAEAIFPNALYVFFVVGGGIGAIASSLLGGLGMFRYPLLQVARDGWLPSVFTKTDKNGYPYVIYLLFYIISIIPIVTGRSLDAIVSQVMIPTMLINIYMNLTCLTLPKKYPEQWAQRSIKMPLWFYNVCCVLGAFCAGVVAFNLFKDLEFNDAVFAVVIVVVMCALSILRLKQGAVKADDLAAKKEEIVRQAIADTTADETEAA